LVIEVGVNVTKSGRYLIIGSLYENKSGEYILTSYNETYLDVGNHTVWLKFDGSPLYRNGYNGTYDLKYLSAYNTTNGLIVISKMTNLFNETEIENRPIDLNELDVKDEEFAKLYGERLDRIETAYTTKHYNYTEFQIPWIELTGYYNDYGLDTNGNGLYDYLPAPVTIDYPDFHLDPSKSFRLSSLPT